MGSVFIKTAKVVAARVLPRRVRHGLRKWRAPGMVRSFPESGWPCAPPAKALLAEGDCAVDVGANIGYITGLFVRWTGPAGRVISLEPVPDTFEILQAAVQRNRYGTVTCVHAAASSAGGKSTMTIPRYDHGEDNFYEASLSRDASGGRARTVTVPLVTLDDVLADVLGGVALVKVDVEGQQGDVVGGAVRLADRSRPAWIVEVTGNPDDPEDGAARLVSWFAKREYGTYRWDGASLRPRGPGDSSVDYLFLRPEHLERIRRSGLDCGGGGGTRPGPFFE